MGQVVSRRECLQMLALSAGWAATSVSTNAQETTTVKSEEPDDKKLNPLYQRPPGHERRMAWWREAKFGMFIHFGLYSILGRGEWVMVIEDIPIPEYEQLAHQFNPHPNAARDWARLAKRAGMKYMVMTTKHHDGFCLFDSHFTDYNAVKKRAGRDLVREYVDAARAEGLRVGLYFSLMDWHSPDWAVCNTDAAAAKRFVDRVHGELRQLMTEYGKIDELWYDGAYPFDADGWRSPELNDMVFELQPEIVINNRSWMACDFSTPEQSINASKGDWESCMTLNDHWGYGAADENWKSPRTLISNLVQCAENGGNYLLNIGPKADGSTPEPSVRILESVGKWIEKNNESLHGVSKSEITIADGAFFSKKGNSIYIYLVDWPGSSYTIGGINEMPKSARYLATGQQVKTEIHGTRLVFTGLPEKAPDEPITVIVAEFETAPVQDSAAIRIITPFTKLIQDEVKMGWS